MKRLWTLLLAFVLAGGMFAEEAPAGSLDFMYLNLDKFVFGRPTIAGHLSMAGAEAVIRLNLEHANYCVSVAINTDNFTKDKISVIRNHLTSWLLNIGAREVYFRSTVTGETLGAPVKVAPRDNPAPVRPAASAVKTLTKQAAAKPAATAKPQPQKKQPAAKVDKKGNKTEKLPPLEEKHIPAAPVKGPAAPVVKTALPEAPAVTPVTPRPAEKAAPANPAPAAAKVTAPKPVTAPAKIDPVAPLLPPVDLPEAPLEPLKTTPPAK